jgi:hypothetical protein
MQGVLPVLPGREYNVEFLEAGAALLDGDLKNARHHALRSEQLMPAIRDALLAGQVRTESAVILAWARARREAVEMLRSSLDASVVGMTPLPLRNDPLLTKPLSGFEEYEEITASLPERFGT